LTIYVRKSLYEEKKWARHLRNLLRIVLRKRSLIVTKTENVNLWKGLMMDKRNWTRMAKCDRCKKKTTQENRSEGFAGKDYYEDWYCLDCDCIMLEKKRGNPKFETVWCISG